MFNSLTQKILHWLINLGFSSDYAEIIASVSDFLMILALGVILYYITKFIIIHVIKRLVSRTKSIWDDILVEYKVFSRMAFLVPGILVYQSIPATLSEFPGVAGFAVKLTNIYIVVVFLLIINAFLNALYAIYQQSEYSRFHPIKGYVQVGKIVVYIIGILLILSCLFNQSPLPMLGGLGAFSAILLLVFKDPIMGFVGSIQLSANDMVRPGDWISMQKFGADGTVQDISLTTVKVQNWDNTITTVPTYSLVAESFQNFRGMQESGARRMKRAISIDMSSVKFCSHEMLEKFSKIRLITEYIRQKEKELNEYNESNTIDDAILVNGRRQTNIGVFRIYLEMYLANHPQVNNNMDLLVRQLQPTNNGIPIEIYAFTQEVKFARYENVQSDIFDHILAIVPEFELRVFQSPSGEDLRKGTLNGSGS